ncbi:MAG: YraN family protein [Opitutales bacterium]|nr:YraN family protein [Opitutales bacterium]
MFKLAHGSAFFMFPGKLNSFIYKLFRLRRPIRSSTLGKHGEKLALKFLKKKKYKILRKNWRYKHSELDLVACDKDVIVFVEVRLRDKDALVRGVESISKQKMAALRRACYAYLKQYAPNVSTYRFDVIDIEHDNSSDSDTIYHFENVKLF